MAYGPWHERYPHRLAAERAAMQHRGFTFCEDILRAEGRIEFVGALSNGWPATILYPGSFPSKPPHLCTHSDVPLLRRHHRPDTREICTFGPNQVRWDSSMDGTSVIDEAEAVIADVFAANGEDIVPEPASALYTYDANASVLIPFTPIIPSGAELEKGVFRLRKQAISGPPTNGWRGIIVETTLRGRTTKAPQPYREWLQGTQEIKGTLVVTPTPPPYFITPADLKAYLDLLKTTRGDFMAFLFPEQSGSTSGQRWAWLMIQSTGNFHHRLIRSFQLDSQEQQIRIPGLGQLREKRILIIGCGSIGSKLAMSLAATGVRRFGFIDADHMEPFNAVRHEVGVHAFGMPKVTSLAHHLVQQYGIAAEDIHLVPLHIGAHNTSEAERAIVEAIEAADLVIDATGNHGASHFINDMVTEHRIPTIYVSITGGGWTGEIVRYVPGISACWNCWRSQYYDEHRQPSAPDGEVFPPGCDQPTFTGTTYEIGMTANLAAQIAVDMLVHEKPEFPNDYVVWHGRDEHGRLSLTTTHHPVSRRSRCNFCDSPCIVTPS